MSNLETVISVITPTLLAFVVALVTVGIKWAAAKAAWFEARAREWEVIAMDTKNSAEAAKNYNEDSRKMIEETTKLTRRIEKQGDGMNRKLQGIAVASALDHGKLRELLKTKYNMEDDDLDKITETFKESRETE